MEPTATLGSIQASSLLDSDKFAASNSARGDSLVSNQSHRYVLPASDNNKPQIHSELDILPGPDTSDPASDGSALFLSSFASDLTIPNPFEDIFFNLFWTPTNHDESLDSRLD